MRYHTFPPSRREHGRHLPIVVTTVRYDEKNFCPANTRPSKIDPAKRQREAKQAAERILRLQKRRGTQEDGQHESEIQPTLFEEIAIDTAEDGTSSPFTLVPNELANTPILIPSPPEPTNEVHTAPESPSPGQWITSTTPRPTTPSGNFGLQTPVSQIQPWPTFPPRQTYLAAPTTPRPRASLPFLFGQPLVHTHAQTPQTQTTVPTMTTTTGASAAELKAARERIDRFRSEFDGTETTITEAQWRSRFKRVASYHGLDDTQKLEMWKDFVAPGTPAGDWVEMMETANKIDTWAELETELAIRWPGTTSAERERERMSAFMSHYFDEGLLGTFAEGVGGRVEGYWVTWARSHAVLATAAELTEVQKVSLTWTTLPLSVKNLLGGQISKFTRLQDLCGDMIALDTERVLDVVERAREMEGLMNQIGNMAISAQQQNSRQTPTMAKQAQTFYPRNQARFSNMPTFPNTPARVIPQATTIQPSPSFARQNTPAPVPTVPRTPGPLGAAFVPRNNIPTTPAGNQPPRTPVQVSYSISPGTMPQTERVCVRCGRGEHASVMCNAQALPEAEIRWREARRRQLVGERLNLRTSPTQRSMFQVLVDGGFANEAVEAYDSGLMDESGNGLGQ